MSEKGVNIFMKNTAQDTKKPVKRKRRPATSPEARENQLIALAVDLAEQQLMEGTASSQVITHYLKMGSTKERLEKEILKQQKELMEAKTESIRAAQRVDELYADALRAMREYSGNGDCDDTDV